MPWAWRHHHHLIRYLFRIFVSKTILTSGEANIDFISLARFDLFWHKGRSCDWIRSWTNIIVLLKAIAFGKAFDCRSKELKSLWLGFWSESTLLTVMILTRTGNHIFIVAFQDVLNATARRLLDPLIFFRGWPNFSFILTSLSFGRWYLTGHRRCENWRLIILV